MTSSGGVCGETQIRGALIDLSGTLHVEDEAIPGATQALRLLREAGVRIRFLSNTTKESGENNTF